MWVYKLEVKGMLQYYKRWAMELHMEGGKPLPYKVNITFFTEMTYRCSH